MSSRRLMRELKRMQEDPPAGISAAPQDNKMMLWNAVISGPEDTPWDGGMFKLIIQIPTYYPIEPPTVQFVSRMFHPNIYADGKICLDILQDMWCPAFHLSSILTSIQSFLCDPNPDVPANSEAAQLFIENKRLYNRKIREIVEESLTRDEQLNQKIERLNQTELKVVEESLTNGEQLNRKTEKSSWFGSIYENLKIQFFGCFKPNRTNIHP